MTTQFKFRLFILLPILLLSIDTFARAGGGGGGGGKGGGVIGLILWGIYTLVVSIILFFKVGKSKKITRMSAAQDSFWNFDQMRDHAKQVFFKMQEAWMNRDIDSVKHIITPRLYEDYKTQLETMKSIGEKNILSGIYVSNVKIIGCEDYLDNSYDSYIAHIKGDMLDYTINEQTKEVIKNQEKENERFTDTYHFIRKDNQWLLDHIDNKVSIWDLINTRNYHEEQISNR
ncbi:MAG: Tim44 domain-containing protein [Candidatus Saccharibacteria bacterium]